MSGLKKDIVFKSKFTVKTATGGTNGATPGNYVVQYAARPGATESIEPIRLHRQDDFILRYYVRKNAVEQASTLKQVQKKMSQSVGKGGTSFGYGSISLAHDELLAAAADIQDLFENNHTVMNSILSFDHDYLKRRNLVAQDFVPGEKGCYRGQVDQLKLRMAIDRGISRIASDFDDLRYVAAIQVDTKHVHCHLSLVDAGRGNVRPDGQQVGKINSFQKSKLRRGIDSFLDEKQRIRHLSSASQYERRNTTTYVKQWAYDQILQGSTPQFLLACLPEDKRLWRARTNNKDMRRPNALVRELVEDVLEKPDSPMVDAMASVQDYANERRRLEDLSNDEWHELVDTGRERIIENSMNGVYRMLSAIPETEQHVRTPTIEIMSMDYDDLVSEFAQESQKSSDKDELVEFSFRLRSYSSRKQRHRQEREQYRESVRSWDSAHSVNKTDEASRVLRDFYAYEEWYHAQLASKYQHLLPFSDLDYEWQEKWEQLEEYNEKVLSLQLMMKDRTLRTLHDGDEAERLGVEIYGQRGGEWLTQGEQGQRLLSERLERMQSRYDLMREDFIVDLSNHGYLARVETSQELFERQEQQDGSQRVVPEIEVYDGDEFPFSETRALDLHELEYDFAIDIPLTEENYRRFADVSRQRMENLDYAIAYLELSGQSDLVSNLPLDDIQAMHDFRLRLESQPDSHYLPSRLKELADQQREKRERRLRTVAISEEFVHEVQDTVYDSVKMSRDRLRDEEPVTNTLEY